MIETLKHILNIILTSNALNFVIMIGLLVIIYKKANVDNIFKTTIEKVSNRLKDADDTLAFANKKYNEAKTKNNNLPNDIKQIQKTSKSKTIAYCNKIEENTKNTISTMEKNVDRVISVEEKKLSNVILQDTMKHTIEDAKNNLIKKLNENPELHNEFIMNSLEELEKAKL